MRWITPTLRLGEILVHRGKYRSCHWSGLKQTRVIDRRSPTHAATQVSRDTDAASSSINLALPSTSTGTGTGSGSGGGKCPLRSAGVACGGTFMGVGEEFPVSLVSGEEVDESAEDCYKDHDSNDDTCYCAAAEFV